MLRLLLLFIAVPLVELALLIEIGRRIGTMWTLALIVVTGLVGATLARWQGLRVIAEIRETLRQGRLPAGPVVDGVLILLAAAVLMTPGVLTDALGFSLLVPAVRRGVKRELRERLKRKIAAGRVAVVIDVQDVPPRSPDSDRPRRVFELPEQGGTPPSED